MQQYSAGYFLHHQGLKTIWVRKALHFP